MSKCFRNTSEKIGVFLSYRSPSEGGSYTITNDILDTILKTYRKSNNLIFVTLNDRKKILKKKVNKAGHQCLCVEENLLLLKIKSFFFSLFPKLLKTYNFLNLNQYLNLQKKYKINTVWFVSAEYYFPLFSKYISTVWDLQHKTHAQFPEVGSFFRKIYREMVIKNFLISSYKIITGSSLLIKILKTNYNINRNKIIFNQHPTPTIFLKEPIRKKTFNHVNYFLYPANFWQHKNHLNLFLGFFNFNKKNNFKYKLILVGDIKDKLYFRTINLKFKNHFKKNFLIFSFVSLEKLINLYDYSLALVYSSFAGPENLPPLEAMARKKPIICSNYPGSKEQLKNIPIYFNPYCVLSIEKAFIKFISAKRKKNYFIRSSENYVAKVLNEI